MKKHIKKLVALALATLMLLMTACGTQNPSEPSDTDGAQTLDNTEQGSDVVEEGRRGQLINMPESDAYRIEEVDVPNGFTATYARKGYVFTVTNTSSLVQTGQLIWPIPVLALAGMFLLLLGFAILRKTGKQNA